MIEGGEYHDPSEELFTLQNIVEWYPLSISDSKSPQTWPNRDVFYFLDSRQPRPQGFSLKKWVGREKALASAGHVSPRTP